MIRCDNVQGDTGCSERGNLESEENQIHDEIDLFLQVKNAPIEWFFTVRVCPMFSQIGCVLMVTIFVLCVGITKQSGSPAAEPSLQEQPC